MTFRQWREDEKHGCKGPTYREARARRVGLPADSTITCRTLDVSDSLC